MLLAFLTACNPATEEAQVEAGRLAVLDKEIDSGSQLLFIQADGSEKILDEGKVYKEDGSVDVTEVRSFREIKTSGNFAFVEVHYWEHSSQHLYDLQTGQKIKAFDFAEIAEFIPGEELAYACANASAYGTYYAEVINLETQASNILFSEDQSTAPTVAYTTNLECTEDYGEIKATTTNAEAKETVYTYAI